MGIPPVLALLLLLRVIRSFFALSESPFTNSLDSILPALLSTATGNWKIEPLHGLILSPEASCAILYIPPWVCLKSMHLSFALYNGDFDSHSV